MSEKVKIISLDENDGHYRFKHLFENKIMIKKSRWFYFSNQEDVENAKKENYFASNGYCFAKYLDYEILQTP